MSWRSNSTSDVHGLLHVSGSSRLLETSSIVCRQTRLKQGHSRLSLEADRPLDVLVSESNFHLIEYPILQPRICLGKIRVYKTTLLRMIHMLPHCFQHRGGGGGKDQNI